MSKSNKKLHDRGKRLEKAWKDADSLHHAIDLAGIKISDSRARRRLVQKLRGLGYRLPTHHEKYKITPIRECPSTLEMNEDATEYIISSCTNNSPLNKNFLDSLEWMADERGAQLLILPVPYENQNILTTIDDFEWPSRIYKYVLNNSMRISKYLLVESDADMRATLVNPLSGMHHIGGTSSVIYGHPNMAMELVAAPAGELPKMMHTTGSINESQYSVTKAGKAASEHHKLAALHVKIDGSKFFVTQLEWDGDGFNFYNQRWNAAGRQDDEPIAGLHMGDYHTRHMRDDVREARSRLIDMTDPKTLVWNDTLDFDSQNHHHQKMDHIRRAMQDDDLVERELDEVVEHINDVGSGRENYIVESNHDDALTRWLNRYSDHKDPRNAPFYWWLMNKWFENEDKTPFELAVEDTLNVDYTFVGRNDSERIAGILVSQHGDVGINGARGSKTSFAKSMYEMIVGHGHSPYIYHHVWGNGTSTDQMGYRKGLSTWMLSDVMIYRSGKRAFVFYINGECAGDLL